MEAKHPRGLRTLFFTEMWERFSYYGMRALLVLFLVDQTRGGFGLSDATATAIYGLYTAAVYLAALPGGWAADRIFGAQRAVWFGGILIACGHFTLALDRLWAFYIGLQLIVIGTGLLKPNISAIVGDLYPEGGARRDAGFTIFYMGINLGAALGPLVCSALGEKIGWQYGFGAAGLGMVLGLVQFHFAKGHLGDAGISSAKPPLAGVAKIVLLGVALAWIIFVTLCFAGKIQLDPPTLARWSGKALVALSVVYFIAVFCFFKLDGLEKRRVGMIVVLFVASAIFWAGFEQMGSSFNLFAERHTDRILFTFEAPAGWFQTLGPIFIISLAPVIASIWIGLAQRNVNPSIPTKFALSLLFLAAGFVVMALAAKLAAGGVKVAPTWLITTYFLHTVGELCLSPVGLSSITKLAPKRLVGQMMGVWFMATSLGNLFAGLMAGEMSSPTEISAGFWKIAAGPALAGIVLLLLAKPFTRWMGSVR